MAQLLLLALATFASEDLACIAAGALIASGKLGFIPGVLACMAGIFAGDLLLYLAGRSAGRPIVRRLLAEERLERASRWLAGRGAAVVLLSRFTPGLRLPAYVAAGLLKTRFWTFAGLFLLAALLWTPLLVGAAALLGRSLPRLAFAGPVLLLLVLPWKARPGWHARRRTLGWLRRKTRWEFWPPWLAYLPVIPYLLYLGVRYRSLTLFTAANPGIPSGGFAGESKSAILARLPRVPEWFVAPAGVSDALEGVTCPVVLKPDVGERGTGVVIARTRVEAEAYLRTAHQDTIVQRYVGGMEFGVFYYRYPGEPRGRILSITRKEFPFVTGDGVGTIADLVLRDARAVCLADLYLSRLRRGAHEVPAAGETIPLAEIGSHCRGAVFLNGANLETEALRATVDAVARCHPGFYFGRFDLRSPSWNDFQAGRFEVLELNGVTAEATHIYDPSVGLLEAYRVLRNQWRIAFEIGAANRRRGVRPMRLRDFARLIHARLR